MSYTTAHAVKLSNLPQEIHGSMDGGVFVISKDLSDGDRRRTIKLLNYALYEGYNICVVTSSGTYATKKITSRDI